MQQLRPRFTVRSLIIAVALVGLNLAGPIAVSKYYPRQRIMVPIGFGDGRGFIAHDGDGNTFVSDGNGETGYRLVRVEKRPVRPTLLQIWSPVIASASITLLVLLVPFGHPASRHQSTPSRIDGAPSTRPSRVRFAARWATIVAALIALNLAGAVYRSPPDRSDPWWDTSHLFYRIRGTIICGTDGSIVAYEGIAGQMLSRPRVIRPPTRPFLQIWSPVIASGTITIVVLVVTLRQSWKGALSQSFGIATISTPEPFSESDQPSDESAFDGS